MTPTVGVHLRDEPQRSPTPDPPPGRNGIDVRPAPAGSQDAGVSNEREHHQEALTNAIKHAGPTAVRVLVDEDGTQLALEVTNRGGQAPVLHGEGSGHGIPAMRERAMALGGTLEAGPLPDGGFRVRAALPVPGGLG
jgi:hypothetical protein